MTTPSTSPRAEGPPDSKMASGCNYRGRRHVPAEGSVMWHTGINDLPDELLLMILSHVAFTDLLDVVPNVCRRWKKLSQDSKLWADREFNIGALWQCYLDDRKGGGNEQEAIEIFRNIPNLCIVRMWFNVNPLVIQELCDHCPRLAELHLHPSQKLTYSIGRDRLQNTRRGPVPLPRRAAATSHASNGKYGFCEAATGCEQHPRIVRCALPDIRLFRCRWSAV
ncbi:uncharacterized protein LOC124742182 [Schistocerca piceifrons]|uniref:uncharacterized protein LOC124742182 n=1 Tax=Schistocerca piceifrons TaxID=274613 RepID=UPI001F5F95C3|nr:uncharacterized protein LOC124742182 [Schistocerca piceifrons]